MVTTCCTIHTVNKSLTQILNPDLDPHQNRIYCLCVVNRIILKFRQNLFCNLRKLLGEEERRLQESVQLPLGPALENRNIQTIHSELEYVRQFPFITSFIISTPPPLKHFSSLSLCSFFSQHKTKPSRRDACGSPCCLSSADSFQGTPSSLCPPCERPEASALWGARRDEDEPGRPISTSWNHSYSTTHS